MRSTARTRRLLQEIEAGQRNGSEPAYADGVTATLRWMLRVTEDEPIAKEKDCSVEAVSEQRADMSEVRPAPKPAAKQVRRRR